MGSLYFQYGEQELAYLKSKDKKLAAVIERVGPIKRAVDGDLFSSVLHHIIGQQISTKAQQTIWTKLTAELELITPDTILACGRDRLQAFGTTWKKADYILDFAQKVQSGKFGIEALNGMTDAEAIAALCSLKGIGVWTAEMILLFCFQRPNIFSYGDLAIQRGVRMVYRHKELPKERFERYRRRFSPYCSTASLYFWAVAGGAVPELTDPAAKK
ncbi:MAG TPA: DNA-3-methyladenine glycosylase 2 family protein [Candidatus Avidehalobacter gallistercoris]|uniref:DNA-3-methyladenine glycosylase II n=1 Tax=Candidatus Avidehalobacter gallistercoris TaxID=2840694 RepID=A0A9D1HKX2_9FIRM|nr:DNA-3-methyladenine glycosylase 2 family protein [Candidatus Avidehalobacter gallistercoris]